MENPEFLSRSFNGCFSSFDEANTVVFGAPYDGTVSFRPGTRFAPQVMRIESIGVETYSPYLDLDTVEDAKIHDAGDLSIPFGDSSIALQMIEDAATRYIQAGKRTFMVGGEHLVTLPAFKAALKKYPDLCLIHFDAHTDLREDFLGIPMSHATVIRKIWDEIGDGRIYQFGIRSGAREEFCWAASGHTTLQKNDFTGLAEAVAALGDRPVYFTLDLDVLDPSIMSGTGTTEGGGVTFKELLGAIQLVSKCNLVAADMVELAPHYDQSGVSTAVACKLLRELLLILSVR